MACDDATTSGWVRTREQIDGGPFRQPRPYSSADEADTFLLELDQARTRIVPRPILEITLIHEKARFRELPLRSRVAFSVNRAQYHGLTSTLAGFPRFSNVVQQTKQTMKLLRLASAEARVLKSIPPDSEFTYQAPVVVPPGAVDMSHSVPSGRKEPKTGERPPLDLVITGRSYSKAGRNISRRLVDFLVSKESSWPKSERDDIGNSYTIEEHVEYGVSTRYPKMISCSCFIRLARKARQSGWVMDDELASLFITAITGRRKLREWHDRLPIDDPRFREFLL